MKILKYYNSTILYKSPKNPIFVQLSPIQCTYLNIFIRFFKFFPANTNIYQISYSVIGVLCGLRQGVLSSQCGHLISFGTKYLMSLQCGVHISFGTKYFMSLRGIANGDAVAISRKGIRFLFSPVAPTFIVFYTTVNMTLLPNI